MGKYYTEKRLKKFTVLGVIIGTVGFVILIFPSLAAQFVEIDSPNAKFEFVGIIALVIVQSTWQSDRCIHIKQISLFNVFISTGMMLFVGGFFLIVLSIATGELQNFH